MWDLNEKHNANDKVALAKYLRRRMDLASSRAQIMLSQYVQHRASLLLTCKLYIRGTNYQTYPPRPDSLLTKLLLTSPLAVNETRRIIDRGGFQFVLGPIPNGAGTSTMVSRCFSFSKLRPKQPPQRKSKSTNQPIYKAQHGL